MLTTLMTLVLKIKCLLNSLRILLVFLHTIVPNLKQHFMHKIEDISRKCKDNCTEDMLLARYGMKMPKWGCNN